MNVENIKAYIGSSTTLADEDKDALLGNNHLLDLLKAVIEENANLDTRSKHDSFDLKFEDLEVDSLTQFTDVELANIEIWVTSQQSDRPEIERDVLLNFIAEEKKYQDKVAILSILLLIDIISKKSGSIEKTSEGILTVDASEHLMRQIKLMFKTVIYPKAVKKILSLLASVEEHDALDDMTAFTELFSVSDDTMAYMEDEVGNMKQHVVENPKRLRDMELRRDSDVNALLLSAFLTNPDDVAPEDFYALEEYERTVESDGELRGAVTAVLSISPQTVGFEKKRVIIDLLLHPQNHHTAGPSMG